MTGKELLKRVVHIFSAAVLCMAVVFASTASAGSGPTVKENSCAALDVQTDVRPDAGGPPTKVSVGIRMIDLMEISDVNQTLTGDFAVMLPLIAFIFATTNMVPELGYLTRLDRFIVGSTILVFLALIETAVSVYMVSHERTELVLRMDHVCRLVFPLAFGVLIFSVFFR